MVGTHRGKNLLESSTDEDGKSTEIRSSNLQLCCFVVPLLKEIGGSGADREDRAFLGELETN